MGPRALARAPKLRSVPMTTPFCPGEPVGERGEAVRCLWATQGDLRQGKGLSP